MWRHHSTRKEEDTMLKKPYTPPKLEKLGLLRQLTRFSF